MKKVAVSSCLLGENVRYDGTNKINLKLIDLLKNHKVVPICPEILSGFCIPHSPIEILNNRVIDKDNNDLTDKLNKGCKLALEKVLDCDFVILKSKSPSCGYKKIYDGTFSNNLIDGNGIFTKLCIQNKIKVFNDEDFESYYQLLK